MSDDSSISRSPLPREIYSGDELTGIESVNHNSSYSSPAYPSNRMTIATAMQVDQGPSNQQNDDSNSYHVSGDTYVSYNTDVSPGILPPLRHGVLKTGLAYAPNGANPGDSPPTRKKFKLQRSVMADVTAVKPSRVRPEQHSSGTDHGVKHKLSKPQSADTEPDMLETGAGEHVAHVDKELTGGNRLKKKKKHKRRDRTHSNVSSETFILSQGHANGESDLMGGDQGEVDASRRASIISSGTYVKECEKMKTRHRTKHSGFHLDERKISEHIGKHFKHRRCNKYVIKKDGVCHCGQDADWHKDLGLFPAESGTWTSENSTVEMVADTFGEINFSGFGHESTITSPYIRVDHKTRPHVVWKLLDEYWHLPPPRLIISVTGGAKQFFMKNRLLNIFKRGLINAATTTGAWIITGGTNTGVMKYVGEAVRDHLLSTGMVDKHKVVALGIATWGIIDNNESLMGEEGVGCFPAFYNAEQLSSNTRKAPIDHNHSHFIFVDNGTVGKFGVEINFRVQLENFISTKLETEVSADRSVYIPVVLLVVEGGIGSLKTAGECVENNIPIVVIQGSGRAADYIAMAFKETKPKDINDDVTKYGQDFVDRQRLRALKLFEWANNMSSDEKKLQATTCVENLKKCLSNRRMVTVFYLDDGTTSDMELAILSALLKANKTNAQSQLDLAMALNRCDIARTEIFNYANLDCWKKINLEEAMFTALVQNRVDFVQLFLDNGVEPSKFLNIQRLHDLFKQVLDDPSVDGGVEYFKSYVDDTADSQQVWCSCHFGYKDKFGDQSNLLHTIGLCLVKLLGDHYPNTYEGADYLASGVVSPNNNSETRYRVVNETQRRAGRSEEMPLSSVSHQDCGIPGPNQYNGNKFDNPERELLLWAVLLNRYELAEMFWKSGTDHIGTALTASALFRSLSKVASSDEVIDLSQEYLENAAKFEQLALGVLNECHQKDKGLTQLLLVREIESLGNTTALGLAENAHRMDFMEHASCQAKINTVWKGNMALYTSYWKIILAMLIPLFVPLIKYVHTKRAGYEGDEIDCDEHEELTRDEPGPSNVDGGEASSDVKFSGMKQRTVKGRLRLHAGRKGVKKLREVSLTGQSVNKIGLCDAVHYFYTAPVTKFMFNIVSYLIFLGIFSYFLLIELCPLYEVNDVCRYGSPPGYPSLIEYVTWAWCFTLICEECRQVFVREPRSLRYKIKDWFHDVWNKFDLVVYTMFVLSIILRLTLTSEGFLWARITYSLTLGLGFVRFLHMFFVNKNIGPKVIMIRRMVTDLMFFFLILVVFILNYGVMQQALLFPNSDPSWTVLRKVVEQPYWGLYGELFFETFEGKMTDCTNNRTLARLTNTEVCSQEVFIVPLLLAVYMILTNVLLINLLIAMFSYTFQKVQDNSEKVWRFYRYSLISEYLDRPAFAPPLIIFNHIFRFIIFCANRCHKNVNLSTHLKKKVSEDDTRMLRAFEKEGMERYLILKVQQSKEHIQSRVISAGERIEKVIDDLEEIKEQVLGGASTDLASSTENLKGSFDGQSSFPEAELLNKQLLALEQKFQQHYEVQQQQYEALIKLLQKKATVT